MAQRDRRRMKPRPVHPISAETAQLDNALARTAPSFRSLGEKSRPVCATASAPDKKAGPAARPSPRKAALFLAAEVLSALGDIALDDLGGPSLHVHVVLGLSNGSTRRGHLLECLVRPTPEVTLVATPAHLRRKKHPELGIALSTLPPRANRAREGSRRTTAEGWH
jgi:predicted DNA-binding protein with PD1-like motif